MKFLVTGANGFIGSQVCSELLARGADVRGVRRPGSDCRRLADLSPQLQWVDCDLLGASESVLARICEDVAACIHLAWGVVPGQYLTAAANEDYQTGGLRLFAALAGQGCRRITGVGTCVEYEQASAPLDESAPVNPLTPYAIAKLSTYLGAEALFRGSNTAFAWARLFYLYGPWEDPRRLVPDVTLKLLRGERAAVTSGLQVRDFLHVTDVARALVDVSLSQLRGPVNIGSGDPVQVSEVVQAIGVITGRADLIDVGGRAENLMDPPYVCADNRRLRDETGWRPHYGLLEGLEQTIAWWRASIQSPARSDAGARRD
jgi:nucleoside-diphosphate-sugar epimerase